MQTIPKVEDSFSTGSRVFNFLKKKMEAIRQKLNEADDIAEVIDSMQNLSILIKGWQNIEDMKERMLTRLSSQNEVRLSGQLFNFINLNLAASIL